MKKKNLKNATRKNIGVGVIDAGLIGLATILIFSVSRCSYLLVDMIEWIICNSFKTYACFYDILHSIFYFGIFAFLLIQFFHLYDYRKEYITAWNRKLNKEQ